MQQTGQEEEEEEASLATFPPEHGLYVHSTARHVSSSPPSPSLPPPLCSHSRSRFSLLCVRRGGGRGGVGWGVKSDREG